jgi:RIO kinase 1
MGELYQAGADVPQPLNQSTNAILMDFIGDEDTAAPILHEVSLEADEAQAFFTRVIGNIEVLLSHHMIHGDLSAYNILYWNGDFKIIDFPQVVDATHNSNALSMLARDVERVCDYFARFGVASHPAALTESLWHRYRRGEFWK